jgi:hypothetical protein
MPDKNTLHRVSYNGLVTDVRDEDLQAGIALLTQCSRQERKRILRSVKKSLERICHLTEEKRNSLTKQQLQDAANDIGIWLAGEMLEGRAEQYKQLVH